MLRLDDGRTASRGAPQMTICGTFARTQAAATDGQPEQPPQKSLLASVLRTLAWISGEPFEAAPYPPESQ